jgi:hypothetical protein
MYLNAMSKEGAGNLLEIPLIAKQREKLNKS